MVEDAALSVLRNVHVFDESLIVLDVAESFLQASLAVAQGLHLRSRQHDASGKGLFQLVIMLGLAIRNNGIVCAFGRHKSLVR